MQHYTVIAIDLAKTNFHLAAMNDKHEIAFKCSIKRKDFFEQLPKLFPGQQTFAFEACGGCHYMAQQLKELGHKVILLKPQDVKPYSKARQKNDINDAIGICKAALDPELVHVKEKSPQQQQIAYLHKSRQNVIQQRIQRSNSLMNSLFEFGYMVKCGKAKFAAECKKHLGQALQDNFITEVVYQEMLLDCEEIEKLIAREKVLDKKITDQNKLCENAQLLATIPGIGPINASILSIKAMEIYDSAKDFAASLGIVPRQNTTGGNIQLGSITKKGDRYARTMLIQAARAIVMRAFKPNIPNDSIYHFVLRLQKAGKRFNVICVAVANKLARTAYACVMKKAEYNPAHGKREKVS